MKQFNPLIIILVNLLIAVSVFGSSPTAEEILRNIDGHRLVSDSFEMTIKVDTFINGQKEGSTVMEGRVDHGKLTSLTFVEPSNMKGRKILISDNDMKLIIPNVKNPVRITASQRLVGGISYGDVAAVSYGDAYTPKLIGEEQVAGMNSDGTKTDAVQCFVLELLTNESISNYHKIILWVEKQNYLPVKGDFYALSGKKMTTVYYTSPREWRGKDIITKMFLFDQINTSKHFSMEYSDFIVTGTAGASEN
jgi:hypothetical protein